MENLNNKKQIYKRRIYIIKKKLQYKYIALVFLSMILTAFTIGADIYYTMNKAYADAGYMVSFPTFISAISTLIILKTIILITLMISVAVLVSHKLAGPIYRFEKSCEVIGTGDFSYRVNLRKGDELMELKDEFNKMLESLSKKLSNDREKTTRISSGIEDMIETIKNKKFTDREINSLINQMEEIKQEINKLTMGFKV